MHPSVALLLLAPAMIVGSPIWLPQNQADVDKLGVAKEANVTPGISIIAQNVTQEDIEKHRALLEQLAGSGSVTELKNEEGMIMGANFGAQEAQQFADAILEMEHSEGKAPVATDLSNVKNGEAFLKAIETRTDVDGKEKAVEQQHALAAYRKFMHALYATFSFSHKDQSGRVVVREDRKDASRFPWDINWASQVCDFSSLFCPGVWTGGDSRMEAQPWPPKAKEDGQKA